MDSGKSIVILVLAVLAQSSCAEKQRAVYGLSEEQSVNFYKIVENQKLTVSLTEEALKPIFDVLEILSANQRYSLHCEDFDYSSFLAEGLVKAKLATEYLFKTGLLILGESSKIDVEPYLLAAYGDLENVYNVQINGAIALGLSRNYVDLRAEFEPFYAGARASLGTLVGRIYKALRFFANSENADTLAELKAREANALKVLLESFDALYDAIRVFASGVVYTSDVGIVHDISYYRSQSSFAMRDCVEATYVPYRAFYISNRLNKQETAANFITEQHAQVISTNRYQAATRLIFGLMRSFLRKFQFGLSGGSDDDFAALDAVQAKASHYFKAALRAFAASIPAKDPISQTVIQTGLKFFEAFSDASAVAYFGAIRLALTAGSSLVDTLAKIEAAKLAFLATFPAFVTTVFSLVFLGGASGGNSNTQAEALEAGRRYVASVFEAAQAIARASQGGKVTEAEFALIDAAEEAANAAVGVFTSVVSFGRVTVIGTFTAVISGIASGFTSAISSIIPVPSIPGSGGGGGFSSFFG